MRNPIIFILASVLVLIGCTRTEKPEADAPKIEFSSQNNITIPAEGGEFSFSYKIVNPVDNGQISAAGNDTWIHDFNCDNPGEITFIADPNELTESRSLIITVTYTYGDGKSVQAHANVIQGVAASYDYNSTLTIFSGTYFGDRYGKNGEHNFYTWLSDKELVNNETMPGGTYYLFDIYTPAPENTANPLPPAGEYTLGLGDFTAPMTFNYSYSKVHITNPDGSIITDTRFSEGTLTISYDNGDMHITALLTDEDGKTHHITFEGQASYTDKSSGNGGGSTIKENIDFTATTAQAEHVGNDGNIMEIKVQLTDKAVDNEYLMTLDMIMPYDKDGNIATGTYNISKDFVAMTVYPGYTSEDYSMTDGTFLQRHNSIGSPLLGLATNGTVTISGESGNYTIECDLYTEEGFRLECRYTGELEITGIPKGISTLKGDHTLNLDGGFAMGQYHEDYYNTGGTNWYITIMGGSPDGMSIDLVTTEASLEEGIPSGTYVAGTDAPAPGEYRPGYLDGANIAGTAYFGQIDGEYVIAPAMSGDLIIENHGDGTYTISFEFLDDLGHTWDGSWTGSIMIM